MPGPDDQKREQDEYLVERGETISDALKAICVEEADWRSWRGRALAAESKVENLRSHLRDMDKAVLRAVRGEREYSDLAIWLHEHLTWLLTKV